MTQPDLLRNSPAELERVWRIHAETERRNPYFPPDECEKRYMRAMQKADEIRRTQMRPNP